MHQVGATGIQEEEEEEEGDEEEIDIRKAYGMDGPGSIPGTARFFFSPQHPDRHNILANGYRGLFPQEYSGRSVKLTTHLRLITTSSPPYTRVSQ
jgi:hypothetical protein